MGGARSRAWCAPGETLSWLLAFCSFLFFGKKKKSARLVRVALVPFTGSFFSFSFSSYCRQPRGKVVATTMCACARARAREKAKAEAGKNVFTREWFARRRRVSYRLFCVQENDEKACYLCVLVVRIPFFVHVSQRRARQHEKSTKVRKATARWVPRGGLYYLY